MYDVQLTESLFPAQTDTPYEELTIADAVRRSAEKYPDKIALQEVSPAGDYLRKWTFAELEADAQKLGRSLANRHPRGARIAVFAHNIPEWILLEFACAYAGLVLVTVNPSFQLRELLYVLGQSRSEAIYFVEAVRGNPIGEIVEQACKENDAIKHAILLTNHDALFDGHDQGELRETQPEDIVQIQYTSGTTGFPKGALLHQKGLVQNSRDGMQRGGMTEGDTFINMMPLFHTTGCAVLVLGGVQMGAKMLLPPAFDPVLTCKLIDRDKVNFLIGVATMLVAILEVAKTGEFDVSSIKAIGSGGAMVPPELVRQYQNVFGCAISIVYGQTEASPIITYIWGTESFEDLCETIGQALPHMEVAILDPQTNAVLPLNEQGEICARGYMVMAGYNDNPDATAAAIDKDGWLHTGDLGRMDSRGYLKITGRVKEMIIRGGENIFPVEIENVMLEHPDVVEVAVVGIPDERWGEQIACFMRSGTGNRPDDTALKAYIRDHISPQKTPAYWVWVDEWPLTGSGKIQKFALRDMYVDGQFS